MCSRYETANEAELAQPLKAKIEFKKGTRFKQLIYPGYQAPVILEVAGNRVAEDRFWGFIARFPGKKEPGKMLEKIMQNVVSETVDEKRTFSGAWKKNQRCLIPAKAFFEPVDGKFKPIHIVGQKVLVMAGIYTEVLYKEEQREAFTMLTCKPNSWMEKFHDRMPVILHEDDWQEWLSPDTTPDQAIKLCKPFKGKLEFSKN